MNFVIKILLLIPVVGTVGVVIYQLYTVTDQQLPFVQEQWFGKTHLKSGLPFPKDPLDINKFTLNISVEVLEDLRQRLELARFVEPIAGTNFNYGFNGNYLKQVVDYWKTGFDWRKQELELNRFQQFKTQINGLNIHFLHVKPSKPAKTVIPLLAVHGWGTFWEYHKAIPLLTEPTDDIAFEVICPSIPGYGYSDAPQHNGFDVLQTAIMFNKLMQRLNLSDYFITGGDWGASIAKVLALLYPENIRGLHITTNFNKKYKGILLIKIILGNFFPSLIFENPESDYKKFYPILDKYIFLLKELGYVHIEATKPDTIGAALIDSPVGLAAYILEKFSTWTNPQNAQKSDGGLTEKFTLDELLTNIMIFWTSNTIVTKSRYYKENLFRLFNELKIDEIAVPSTVPTAVADFPHELIHSPKAFTQHLFANLVQYTDMPRGGHFAAFEEPVLFSNDIKKFARTVLAI